MVNEDLEALKRLQASLPWTGNFSPEYQEQLEKGGFVFFDHALKHIFMKASDIMAVVHESEHFGFKDKENNRRSVSVNLAQIVIAALKMAKEYPGGELDITPEIQHHFNTNGDKK